MNVVSLSGGKDSCATAISMWQRGVPIHMLVAVDVGRWEFPQTRLACQQVSDIVGVPLVTLKPVPFDYWMTERLVVKRDGTTSFGAGWPSRQHGRWCTREKFAVFDKFMKTLNEPTRCVGFAADECHRPESGEQIKRRKNGQSFDYPLIEFGITEEEALKLCYDHGIDWDGLYETFREPGGRCPRLSCWCCPHQPLSALRILRKEFPAYWSQMLHMHNLSPQKVFKGWVKDGTDQTVQQLEDRFAKEDKQQKLNFCQA